MDYIKSQEPISTTSITVCIMERHEAGQEQTLMDVMVEMDSLEAVYRPRGSPTDRHGCFKCVFALATVMGLVIVALVVGFILHFFIFTPSCTQAAPSDTPKVTVAYELKKSDEQGKYEIFTVDKAATYLIYGWVKFSDVPGEEVSLMQTWKGIHGTIQKKHASKTEIFFFDKIKLVKNSLISICFNSAYTDSLFHVYEL